MKLLRCPKCDKAQFTMTHQKTPKEKADNKFVELLKHYIEGDNGLRKVHLQRGFSALRQMNHLSNQMAIEETVKEIFDNLKLHLSHEIPITLGVVEGIKKQFLKEREN